jgi:integrase
VAREKSGQNRIRTCEGKARRFFDHYGDAKAFAGAAITARKQKGTQALLLRAGVMYEASVCIDRLQEYSATLTEATDYYIRHHRPSHLNRTFAQVAAEVLRRKRKTNRRKSTLKSYAGYFRRFSADHKKVPMGRITDRDLEAWLDDLEVGPQTFRNYLRNLGVVWNFAVKQGYVPKVITAKIETPAQDEAPTEILTPAQARSLLLQARKPENQAWLPYIAISLFAGLRTNEVQQLTWEQIDFELKHISVTPSQAKTRRRRFVQMSDNLVLWLEQSSSRIGLVTPFAGNAFWDGREKLRESAGIVSWPKNVLRHSFGSYHLAKHYREGFTGTQMGNSPSVIVRHYREMVKPKDADLYWSLSPKTVLD